MPKARRLSLPVLLMQGLPAVFVIFLIALVLYVIAKPIAPPMPVPPAQPGTTPAALQAQLDELRGQVVVAQQQARDVRDVLQLLVLAAGFFTALQGLFNFYSAQNFSKLAERELDHIKDLVADIKESYPNFAEAERRRKDALRDLDKSLSVGDWRKKPYATLGALGRQRIFSLESFVALDFATDPGGADVARNLYNLGKFYRSKYAETDSRDQYDLDRAEYYIKLARAHHEPRYEVLNELALIMFIFRAERAQSPSEKKACLDEGYGFLLSSRAENPRQRRVLYNLAYIEDEYRHHDEAVRLLRAATGPDPSLEPAEVDLETSANYNLACALSRHAEQLDREGTAAGRAQVPALLAEACKALEHAAEITMLDASTLLDKDYDASEEIGSDGKPVAPKRCKGDLGFLASHPNFATQADAIRKMFEERWKVVAAGGVVPRAAAADKRFARSLKAFLNAWRATP
jgi:hypothetical protein